MKNIVKIILFFVSANCFSQTAATETISVSKKKLDKTEALEIISPMTGCEFGSYNIVARISNKLMTASGNAKDFNKELKRILKEADKGTKTYLDMKYKCSSKIEAKAYQITVTE